MAIKNEQNYWMNRNGKYIPPKVIHPYIKKRDAVVNKIIKRAKWLQAKMDAEKKLFFAEAQKYLNSLKIHTGVEDKTTEGNLTLSDYANLQQVELSVNELITFDENLNVAKNLIDKCLQKWTEKGNSYIKAIVQEAFNVDKKGRVNTNMILKLTKLNIEDADWQKAVELIQTAMQVTGSKQYISIRVRESKEDKWNNINLNFSSL